MKKYSIKILFSIVVVLLVSGCGMNVSLPTGSEAFDSGVLSEGRFSAVPVDTSFISGDYYISDSRVDSDGYEYLLCVFDHRSMTNYDYYISLDINGNPLISKLIDKPIYIDENGLISFNSVASDFLDLTINEYFDPRISYSNLYFDDNGGFSSYCNVYYYVYSELLNDYYSVSSVYFIKWDSEGVCISVDTSDSDREYISKDYPGYITGLDGSNYRLTSTGIVLLDQDAKYSSKYFDFLNSDILSYGFDIVNIIDNDHFSAVYMDSDFKTVLCCFVRDKNGITNNKPIVLACNETDIDLKKDVYNFNLENNGYRITVNDFSDRSITCDPSEGWSLLKDEILDGYDPDIILNTTGYDEEFIDNMASSGRIVDIKTVINKDDELKSLKFSDLAKQFYYYGDEIYSIVPSYSYRSVIGSTDHYSQNTDFSYDGFLAYASPIVDGSNIFRDDTAADFLSRFLSYNGYEFVDYKNGTADFDSDVFRKYLELASNLPMDIESSFERSLYKGIENYAISDIYITNLGDYNLYCTVSSLGEYTDIGYPCGENNGQGVISASESYMIVSGRKYTNKCWDFIKKYLSEEYQSSIYDGIPVTQYGYIIWKASVNPFTVDPTITTYFRNGTDHIVANPDEAKVNAILDRIKSCDRKEFSDYKVEKIVLDYARQYFEGKITVEEATASINRDVEAYLQSI